MAIEAAKAYLKYGFDILRLEKIVSFTAAINKKSEQVMQRIGMNHIADFNHPQIKKTDRLCKQLLYELTKQDWIKNQNKHSKNFAQGKTLLENEQQHTVQNSMRK